MIVETTFDSDYYLELGGDLPSTNVYYYPGASRKSGKDGVLVEVINAKGENWTGVFAFGTFSPKGVTGVYQTPNKSSFCVVAKGSGYFVNANDPSDWEEVQMVPVLDIRCLKSNDLLLFANDTELCAYGVEGLRWKSDRLSWHDLLIRKVSEGQVVAEYWNIRDESMKEVRVNLKDGSAIGAAEIV